MLLSKILSKRPGIAAFALICMLATATIPVTPATSSAHQVPQEARLLTDPVPDPKQPGVQWFAPTGHTLRGSFLDYWNRNGGLAQFGYPITEEFTEPIGPANAPAVMVQYFERNRFEHHPENAGSQYEVLLGSLSREFHAQEPPAERLPAPALYFPETGHNLSGTFAAYWQAHGGLAVHGYPITEQFQEKNPTDGKTYTVQYFERSRFELHPENAGTPYEVLLGQLGTQLSQKRGYPYGWYPAYGRAADWSWVAGKMRPPFLMCPNCLCDTILHIPKVGNIYEASVGPIGPVWREARKYPSTEGPYDLIVVFGRLATEEEAGAEPCYRRGYWVEQWRQNPIK